MKPTTITPQVVEDVAIAAIMQKYNVPPTDVKRRVRNMSMTTRLAYRREIQAAAISNLLKTL